MFFLRKKIQFVDDFNVISGNYLQSNIIKNKNDENLNVSKINFNHLFSFGNYEIAVDDLNKGLILNKDLIEFDFVDKFRLSSISYPYIIYYIKSNPRKYGLFDFLNKSVISEANEWLGSDVFFENVFGCINGNITCKSIFNQHLKWQTNISQIGKYIPFPEAEEKEGDVKNFVGVYKYELIVQLTGGKFIGIDVETGTVNWEQNKVTINQTSLHFDYNFSDPYHPFLDEEKGMIYILQGEVFIEFNLNTKIAAYTWTSLELPTENYVFIRQSLLVNNKILFSAFRKGNIGNDDTIGIFDIETKQIVWQHTFDFEKNNFIPNSQNAIQMNETSVYVLDWKGTLHIFEKENSI
ncbi:hypothetical protein [Flavobacterium columnare]|uniref:hypothetical protein n=1 Tax=Flavobacterium columnare TaxID=996 RepID=UPI003BA228E9